MLNNLFYLFILNRCYSFVVHILQRVCCHHQLLCGIYTPVTFGIGVTLVCSKVLFPACIAEEVEREVGATFTFEPHVHVGPSAVITLTRSTLATAWVMTFYMIVKL